MRTSIFSILTYIFLFSISCSSNLSEDNKNDNEIDFPEITDIPSCNNDGIYIYREDGYRVIKVLKDEPAFINKGCMALRYLNEEGFEYSVRVDTFYIHLVNTHSEFNPHIGMFPCGEIPEQYRKEGLSVYISGNVTSGSIGGCPEPHLKLAPMPVFELKAIKINNNKK